MKADFNDGKLIHKWWFWVIVIILFCIILVGVIMIFAPVS
jgi:cytochrome b subunit of formate dehydrogenase